jgi:hypothetical protein
MNSNKPDSKDPLEIKGRAKGFSRRELIQNLPRHKDFSPALIKKLKKIPEVILRNSGTPFAKKMITMLKEVNKETYRAKQFTRTQINPNGVLYGVVLLTHRVIDKVLQYFHKRWPMCIICLYNEKNQKTSIMNENGQIGDIKMPLKKVVEKISATRKANPLFKDLDIETLPDNIYEKLYESQFIEERKNTKLFKQFIPKNCYKLPGLRNGVEKRFISHNKKLDDFLDNS